MKPQTSLSLRARRWALLLGATVLLAPVATAQVAPAATRTVVSPETLAKYDLNKNGSLDAEERAALEADAAKAVAAKPATDEEGADIVELSPFQVSAEQDRGYLATSTMSGTRLNSKLEDLAASISVVTKQQLLDTASTDINDIFMYEASTEGIYQFTSFTVDRGLVTDDISANPYGATRMRGLSAANIASNSFATTLPFDTYNVDSVEIVRGPNSSVFGLGNTGGGVNINSSKANLTRDVTSFGTRADSYGGYRANFDLNRRVIKDKLAVRVLGLYEEKGFMREPSADTTRRLQAAITLRPVPNTTLRASFESYRNFNSRPNSTTPRDMISDWISSGKPTWDPIAQTVHFGDGRAAITGVTTALESTLLPYGLNTTDTGFTGRPSWYIDNGQIQLYTINRLTDATTNATGPQNIGGIPRLLQNGMFYTKFTNQYPLYLTKGITDKSLYDWSEISLTSPNYSTVKGETSSIELEQLFLKTPRQTLALQASWLYERTQTRSRSFLGYSDGGRMQVFIDVNEKLIDGTPNPYLYRPYFGGSEPAYRKSRNNNENYRGTLAYELKLANEESWLRWLGTHRMSAYGEYRSIYGGSLGYKDTISSNEAWMPATGIPSRNIASLRSYPRYYVGDANGYNIDYAPSRISAPTDLMLRYYNGVTGQWINEPVQFSEYYYANRLNRRLLSTVGATWQGFFFKDRIIPTLGHRQDINRTRDGNSAIGPTVATNGYYDQTPMYSFGQYPWVPEDPDMRKGTTRTAGVVVRPLRWLSLTYNQSNAFSPGSLAYNVYGQALPDPRGKTKDYGFYFELFNRRLSISAKQFETLDAGRGTSEINTIVQRAIRLDADGNNTGSDPDLEGWLNTEFQRVNPTWTPAQIETEVLKLMQVDPNFIDSHRNKTHGDNSDAYSRGKEFEVIFNPSNFWTLKGTIAQNRAFNAVMSPALQEYINSRMPIWTTVKGPAGNLWWTTTQVNTTPQAWYTQNVLAPMKLAIATQGKPRTQTREWRANFVTNYRLAGITEHRWLKNLEVGGGFRWEDKGSIGFYGAAPDADGIVRSLDGNKPVWDKSRYYVDVMARYRLRLFKNKVRADLQLNVKNLFEDGRLQAIQVNPDGSPWAFRIIDPRQFIFSARFDL